MDTPNNGYSLDYNASRIGKLFHASKAFVRGVMGPVGCVRGDTKVITEKGAIPISELNQPVRVLSWNEKKRQFQLSLSGGSFPKGKDYLYRVLTTQGEFVASGHHLILTEQHKYQRVDSLVPNQNVCLCSCNHVQTNESSSQKWFSSDVQHLMKKDVDSLVHYAELARQYGQQLLSVADNDQVSAPSQDDVQDKPSLNDQNVCDHKDVQVEQLSSHIRHDQLCDQKQTDDSSNQTLLPHEDVEDCDVIELSEHNEQKDQQVSQFQMQNESHLNKKLCFECFDSFNSCSYTNGTIISVTKLDVKEIFYDMQVAETHNYVTVDGAIHHNSGKSVMCCMEIFNKAISALPCKDGIRRSRWLIVRNTTPQLETTTIKTWLSWFPEHVFGKINMKPPINHQIKFNDVELEVIFLALDRPEDVKKLLSLECTGIWFNEAREILKEIIDAGTMRVGRYPSKKDKPDDVPADKFPSWYGVIMDTNPPDDSHWWYKCAEEDEWTRNEFGVLVPKEQFPENMRWEFWQQPSGLSPDAENIENLPKGYYERISSGKDKEWINVYVHGHYGFIQDGQPVYVHEWNDNLHVKDHIDLNPYLPVYIGLDFGLTPCAIFGQRDKRLCWNVLKELITDDMSVRQFAKLLKATIIEFCPKNDIYIYGDPSGAFRKDSDADTSFQILRSEGLIARPAPTNNIVPRLESVREPLKRLVDGKPAFNLDKSCNVLRKGFNGGYKYKIVSYSGEQKLAMEPDKNQYSHPHDALQYMMMGGGEYKIVRGNNQKLNKTFITNTKWKVF